MSQSQTNSVNSEVVRPDWLNEEFFVEIYAKDERFIDKKLSIKILSCSSVVEVGDNYTSTMYRVNVEASTEDSDKPHSENFIVKAMIHSVPALKEFSIFPIEIEAYEQALPVMEGYWRKIGQNVTFGPKCLHIITDPNEIIVLSDLKVQGFKMANRFEGLDLQHSRLLLSKLAKFHATSVIFKEKNGKFGPKLNRLVFDPQMKKVFETFTSTNYPVLLNLIESSEDLRPFYDIVESWRHNMFERILRISNVPEDSDDFCVLNHADMWVNNHMYKYDENNFPTDVAFIDFQMTHWGRPAVDILYFLLSSVRPEILVKEFDALIYHYHKNLVETLKLLGYQKTPPMLKDIHIQILKCSFYASMCLTGITAVVLMDKNENATFENFFDEGNGGEQMRKKMYFNPRYENKLRHVLPFLEKRGMLEAEKIPDSEIIPIEENGNGEAVPEVSNPGATNAEETNDAAPEEPSRVTLEEAIKEDEKLIENSSKFNGVQEDGLETNPEDKISPVPKDVKETNTLKDDDKKIDTKVPEEVDDVQDTAL